ncbi:histidine kinase internal region [Acetonema longum DSM 6540]|uniref:histidine kinase n=2 Tax=Acetonema TaxID=2373 RepID=F7NKT7_9FIRM|nr:histidine kinase internal region [Acetonema longum DSM 6540]
MAILALVAYLFGRSGLIAKCVNQPLTGRNWLFLTLIFSVLSIYGTYDGIPVEGALANTRLIGTIMSGILGGPSVGLSVGVISGLHRYGIGGFTAEACGIASVLGGLLAGLVRERVGLANMTWKTAGTTAILAELMQKGMVFLLARPFEAVWALESAIAIPTAVVSVLGTVVFMFILKDIQIQQEVHGAKAADLALAIASRTLPYLRHGLNLTSAGETAKIIYQLTKVDAVSITDTEKVLAFVGKGNDHHKAGEPILTRSTQGTIANACLSIIRTAEDRGCPVPGCPLQSGVVAPLVAHGTVVGTVKISRSAESGISEMDVQIARGIAQLLSVQIELAEIDEQKKMREKAEFKALSAQINPHFLFNTLNIIMSFCRTNPEVARELLGHLGTTLRYSFAKHGDFVTIAEEMEEIKAYLEIVKSRFGSRLTISMDVDDTVLNTAIPVLAVQPLVENAIQHGLFPKLSECHLAITALKEEDTVRISVFDNGIGIAKEKLDQLFSETVDGIGVQNVYKRLKGIYGADYGLTLDSRPGFGTWATIRIPAGIEVSCYENWDDNCG